MNENLKYPSLDAVKSILLKLNINPNDRYTEYDQDYEYTTCRVSELSEYINLYNHNDTTDKEKRILGCYFMECLNEKISINLHDKIVFDKIMNLMINDIGIHRTELSYWTDISDADMDNWWPITDYILKWKKESAQQGDAPEPDSCRLCLMETTSRPGDL